MSRSENQRQEAHALTCEMASEILRGCGSLRLQVAGWSMMPTVRPGDTLIVEALKSRKVLEGDIVLFVRDRRLFAHRVVKNLQDSRFITRGDAMLAADPIAQRNELLGRVSLIERDRKFIRPRQKQSLGGRATAALVSNSRFVARVIARLHAGLQSRKSNRRNRAVPCQS